MDITWEMACSFALSRIFEYEPRVSRAIVDRMGDAASVFDLAENQLKELMGPYNKRAESIMAADIGKYRTELGAILDKDYRYLIHSDSSFPKMLSECEDAPVGFFFRSMSAPEEIFGRESVSVVGTRDMSSYGKEWCGRIVRSLGESSVRPSIVSGLAFGVDITAHQAALEADLPTIAVLGTGINVIYPRQHEMYARQMLCRPGCAIVSEYPPDVGVGATNFLSRNRIIAGLSRALVLVESKLKGGGMTTARQAASYNRDVFAVPGRNDDVRSQGCNMLVHSHLAEPLISCEEFLKSLDYRMKRPSGGDLVRDCREFYEGSMDKVKIKRAEEILRIVKSNRDIDIEDIAVTMRLPIGDVLAVVCRLETDGFLCVDLLQRCSVGRGRKT